MNPRCDRRERTGWGHHGLSVTLAPDGSATYEAYLGVANADGCRGPIVGNALSAGRQAAPHFLVTTVPAGHDDMLAHVLELAARLSTTLH